MESIYGRRRGDWMKVSCGDHVRERDGRHEGRVEAIRWSYEAVVKWDNGWISDVKIGELERVKV